MQIHLNRQPHRSRTDRDGIVALHHSPRLVTRDPTRRRRRGAMPSTHSFVFRKAATSRSAAGRGCGTERELCAKLIDTDEARFTVDVLRKWKKDAEERTLLCVERH